MVSLLVKKNGEKGEVEMGEGKEQRKEQKSKLPCQPYLNHYPASGRSWLVGFASDNTTDFSLLFCFIGFFFNIKNIATI